MSQYPNGGTPPTTITEDNPLWNCHTMGNHVCGTGKESYLPITGGDVLQGGELGGGLVILGVLLLAAYKRFIRGGFENIDPKGPRT